MRLVTVLRATAGANYSETRALQLAERWARELTTSLIWDRAEGDRSPVTRAVETLADRTATLLGHGRYRRAKDALADVSALAPQDVAHLAHEVQDSERRAAYYLGLTRGWMAAWHPRGGAR